MKVYAVLFVRKQRGWECQVTFSYSTTEQFTDMCDMAGGSSRWWPLAYLRAKRAVREYIRIHGAKPGERTALGWAE